MLWGVQWYFWLLLLAAVVGLVYAWRKVLVSSKARREKMKKEAAIWKRDYDLREKFSVLTEEKLRYTSDSELLHGVAMNIQIFLEKQADMTKSFKELPIEKQYIYTLEYFDEDAKNSLSLFFKNNGEPLISLASEALAVIGYDEIIDFVKELYPMYDPDSLVSVDYIKIPLLDEKFKEIYNSYKLLSLAAEYIKKNKEIFIN